MNKVNKVYEFRTYTLNLLTCRQPRLEGPAPAYAYVSTTPAGWQVH